MDYDLLIHSKLFWVLGTIVCAFLLSGLAFITVGAVWKKSKSYIGEIIDFKYLYPREIKAGGSYPFLVFGSFVPQVRSSILDRRDIAQVLVKRQVDRLLQDRRVHYYENNVVADKPVPLGKYLRFTPIAKGLRFDPKRVEPQWNSKILAQHFEFTASNQMQGHSVKGEIRVSVWLIAVAHLKFEISVKEDALCEPFKLPELRRGNVIFPSYASEDAHVLSQFENYLRPLGDEYLGDRKIPAGKEWEPKLLEYIAYADLVQLFWSQNAAKSKYVPQEIQRAHELKKTVYPTILEEESSDNLAGESSRFQASETLLKDFLKRFPHLATVQASSHRYIKSDHKARSAYLMAPFISSAGSMASGAVPIFSLAAILLVSTVAGLTIHNRVNKPLLNIPIQEISLFSTPTPELDRLGPTPEKSPARQNLSPFPAPSPTQLTVRSGDAVVLKDQKVWGQVQDEYGKPVANAIVGLTGHADQVKTDAEGRFELDMAGMLPELRSQTKVSITIKANGGEKTIQAETPGRLSFTVTREGSISSDFLWLPYFDPLHGSCTNCCSNRECNIRFRFQNHGGPARSVEALLRVPNIVQVVRVDKIKLNRKGAWPNSIEHVKEFSLRRRTGKAQELIIKLGNISSDVDSKHYVIGIRVYFHIRKNREKCVAENGVKTSGYVLSFIDRDGVRRTLLNSGADEDVHSPCEKVKVKVREVGNKRQFVDRLFGLENYHRPTPSDLCKNARKNMKH